MAGFEPAWDFYGLVHLLIGSFHHQSYNSEHQTIMDTSLYVRLPFSPHPE